MNAQKRKSIREAISLLSKASTIVDSVCDKEMDALDNYPENLQETDAYEKMENAVESMEDATEKIDEAKECLEEAESRISAALGCLQDAVS